MKENDLTIDGPIYQVYKIDVTLTQNREETLLEIQVPVKGEIVNNIADLEDAKI